MENLLPKSTQKINRTSLNFERYLANDMDWNERLIAVKGARGAGKTTLLLQYLKKISASKSKVLYTSLDDIYFSENKLVELAKEFIAYGGTHLFLDEVHKYPNWSLEIKNIYDDYPELKVAFTSSSILEIYKGNADLSRRAVTYLLRGLSFREFLELDKEVKFPVVSLEDIISNHLEIASEISSKIKPLVEFENYFRYGYYPFFKEGKNSYHQKIEQAINLTLETDLPAIKNIDYSTVRKLKKLLYVISESVPFKPNISRLSDEIGATRGSIMQYLDYLERGEIINLLKSHTKGFNQIKKPEKIYLNNNNLAHAFFMANPNKGNARETFFFNQVKTKHPVYYTPKGDFEVDNKYIFEIGGKKKKYNQIKDIPDSYLAVDSVEIGFGNKIPLWLFGFLY